MKKLINLKEQILDKDRIRYVSESFLSDAKRRKYSSVKRLSKNIDILVDNIYKRLSEETFRPLPVSNKKEFRKKERDIIIFDIQDRIIQNIILDVIDEPLSRKMTKYSFNCEAGRGIFANNPQKSLLVNIETSIKNNRFKTRYFLKTDIRKFYDSITADNAIKELSKYIDDDYTLNIIYKYIDNIGKLGIGGPLAQRISNMMMCRLDHYFKEKLKVKFYFRYSDNILIMSDNKNDLHFYKDEIVLYLSSIGLEMKKDWYIGDRLKETFSYCGVKYLKDGSPNLLRDQKKRIAKAINKPKSLASMYGIAMHCKATNFWNKAVIRRNKHMSKIDRGIVGDKRVFLDLVGKKIAIVAVERRNSKYEDGCGFLYNIQFIIKENDKSNLCVTKSGARSICTAIEQWQEECRPFPWIEVVRKDTSGTFFEGSIVSTDDKKDELIDKYKINLDEL